MIMTQDDKDLLLRDLCGRLPYGVIVAEFDEDCRRTSMALPLVSLENDFSFYGELKPYLFPLSSMTEEQRIEASFEFDSKKYEVNILGDIESYSEIGEDTAYIGLESIGRYIDWLNKNHFDYRGLIEKSLAIDATNLEIYK